MNKFLLLILLIGNDLQAQSVEIFAHRGFRGLYTENTLEAFKSALHYTHVLEMDFMVSKDLKLVVTHDPVLHEKLYSYKGKNTKDIYQRKIYDLDYSEIINYQLGNKKMKGFENQSLFQTSIPLLETVFKETQVYAKENNLKKPYFFIETKITE